MERASRAGHYESVSIGCIPRDAKKLNEQLRAEGIRGAEYDMKTGVLHMESKEARRIMVARSAARDESEGC